jgi:hypothetical protein
MAEGVLLTCPKCGKPVGVRDGEDLARCESCGGLVSRTLQLGPGSDPSEEPLSWRLVLMGGLLLVVAGAYIMSTRKPHTEDRSTQAASAERIYTAPIDTAGAAPAGELAWDPGAASPVLLDAPGQDSGDFFGFFRVWDGRSAWIPFGGVFDGATLATRWRTDPIDPQLVKREGVVPKAAVVGTRIVVSDTSSILRVFDLASGNKLASIKLSGAVSEICKPKDPGPAGRIWLHLVDEQNIFLEIESAKTTLAPRPAWCALPPAPSAAAVNGPSQASTSGRRDPCRDDFKNLLARATCLSAEAAPALEAGFSAHYILKDGIAAVVLGTKDARPVAAGIGPGYKVSWTTPLVADDTKVQPEAPHVAEMAAGKVYVVFDKVYFDSRIVALDAETGSKIWDVPLVGSVSGSIADSGRGTALGLVAGKSRIYVSRSGGALDVFDAADGKALGTVGKK